MLPEQKKESKNYSKFLMVPIICLYPDPFTNSNKTVKNGSRLLRLESNQTVRASLISKVINQLILRRSHSIYYIAANLSHKIYPSEDLKHFQSADLVV